MSPEAMMTSCYECDGNLREVSEEREVRVGRRSAVVEDNFLRCEECGEEIYLPGQMDAAQSLASRAIREAEGLLMPEEIREIRESLRLSQADFERLLGVGQKTVVRWENGSVFQNAATDSLMRLVRDVDGASEHLATRHGVALPARRAAWNPLRIAVESEVRYEPWAKYPSPSEVFHERGGRRRVG